MMAAVRLCFARERMRVCVHTRRALHAFPALVIIIKGRSFPRACLFPAFVVFNPVLAFFRKVYVWYSALF